MYSKRSYEKNQDAMKKVGTYINELLFWHDCVIIPGLGGLVANPLSAEIDEEKGLFFPPRKEIGFNRSLSHNDGLLINYVSVREAVDYQGAALLVKQYVDEAIKLIHDGFSFDVDSIGVLKSDAIGNLLFQPFNHSGFLAESFGLSSFHFESGMSEEVEHGHSYTAIRRVLLPVSLRQVAATVALLAGLFLFSPEIKVAPVHQGFNQAGYLSVLFPSSQSAEAIIDEVMVEPSAEVLKVVSEPVADVPVKIEPRYFVIAGSFPSDKLADLFIEDLTKKGITGGIKLPCDGKIRVAIAAFDKKNDAVETMKSYKQRQGFESVWVYAKK